MMHTSYIQRNTKKKKLFYFIIYSYISIANSLKDLESDQLGHIDSPEEISDVTEVLQGESLLEDISSVLGHDLLGAIQDNTITEDTTTICGEHSRRRSITRNIQKSETLEERAESIESANDDPLQFGFENIVFEMDNRCDDQKVQEPSVRRFCSLAHFVEGNDIARKSFKVNIERNSFQTIFIHSMVKKIKKEIKLHE